MKVTDKMKSQWKFHLKQNIVVVVVQIYIKKHSKRRQYEKGQNEEEHELRQKSVKLLL